MIKIGLCIKCRKFFAPTLMFALEDKDQECIFCRTEKDTIMYEKEEGGGLQSYTRREAVKDYKIFLGMLKDKPAIASKLAGEGAKILKET